MVILASSSIVEATFVIGYARDTSIRTKQFEIERILAPLISAPSVNTNLPDDFNPQAPRVVFSQGQKAVHFSQIAAQITINVDNADGTSLEMVRDNISNQIRMFQNCLDQVVPHEQQREHGLVLTAQYPVDLEDVTDEEVCEYIQSRFLHITPLGVPASAGFNVGYKTNDNFFITLTVAPYKSVTASMPASPSVSWFDISSLPVAESGIQLKIDVNSRPFLTMPNKPDDETGIILEKAFNFALLEADGFIGRGK